VIVSSLPLETSSTPFLRDLTLSSNTSTLRPVNSVAETVSSQTEDQLYSINALASVSTDDSLETNRQVQQPTAEDIDSVFESEFGEGFSTEFSSLSDLG